MIANVEKLIEWLEINRTHHFMVKKNESDNSRVFETFEDETFEDAKNRLRRVLEIVNYRTLIVVARRNFNATRCFFTSEFCTDK